MHCGEACYGTIDFLSAAVSGLLAAAVLYALLWLLEQKRGWSRPYHIRRTRLSVQLWRWEAAEGRFRKIWWASLAGDRRRRAEIEETAEFMRELIRRGAWMSDAAVGELLEARRERAA